MNNELNSIEDIDAMLDSQYSVDEEQGTDIEEVQEDTVEEETEVENQEIEEETDEVVFPSSALFVSFGFPVVILLAS